MKQTLLTVISICTCYTLIAQVPITINNFWAKEYSKEQSLYKAKTFVIQLLGNTTETIQFEINPLAAANSGELTTLVYKCENKQKEGLILGFYGSRWNPSGVIFQEYAFKDLPSHQAISLLEKIESVTKENSKYIDADSDNNNIYFSVDDMTILIYNKTMATRIRIYWNGFDSEIDWDTFRKTQKRLLKKLKD